MILVDSSAWIEYYRPQGRLDVKQAVAAAIEVDQVAVNGIVHVEIVTFAPDADAFDQLSSDFGAFHWLELTKADFERASQLGAGLRRQGHTIPATDLIIAACSIRAGATLYHLDAHFDAIALHSELEARNLARPDRSP
jgi:predicted nucleic acid-binding protein